MRSKKLNLKVFFKSRIKVYLYNKLYTEWLWSIVYKWHTVMVWLVLTYCMWYDLDIFRWIYSAYFCSVCIAFFNLTFGWPALMGLCPFWQPCCFSQINIVQWGLGRSSIQPGSNLVHISLKIWQLMATIWIIFLRINWPNFVQFTQ